MVGNDKKRVAVTLTSETLAKVDAIASSLGMNRASACVFLINNSLAGYDSIVKLNPEQLEVMVSTLGKIDAD